MSTLRRPFHFLNSLFVYVFGDTELGHVGNNFLQHSSRVMNVLS